MRDNCGELHFDQVKISCSNTATKYTQTSYNEKSRISSVDILSAEFNSSYFICLLLGLFMKSIAYCANTRDNINQ